MMTPSNEIAQPTRRQFLRQGAVATLGAAATAGLAARTYAAQDQTIRLALIGCGGRGSGAVVNALSVPDGGPVQLYAMADIHEARLQGAHRALEAKMKDKVNVTPDRMFVGFEAYRAAIDALRPGDVALCTTRAYIRPVHVEYAVRKGVNVFMEKPFACDPAGLHRMLAAGELADANNVKIAAGLQCRHSPARHALIERVRNGDLGTVNFVRANRLGGAGWLGHIGDKANNLIDQLAFGRIHLLWVGSGHMIDNLIHQIDECCWIMDAWPVSCVAMGGRAPDSTDRGQNIATYAMEYTFADGRKALCGFRRMKNCRNEFATFIHGSKSAAQFSGPVHRAVVHQYKDQRIDRKNIAWTPTADRHNPWQYEWNHFIDSIRKDKPHNECQRAVYADYASLMGRAAAHTGQTVTWDQVTGSKFQFCDYLDRLDYDSPPPVKADADGQFPVPIPGKWKEL